MALTEEQQLLADSAERYLRDTYDFNDRRERCQTGRYRSPEHWRAFADMGWLALLIPEAQGGLGFGLRDLAILAELCGRYLVNEPLLEASLSTRAFLCASTDTATLLAEVAEGSLVPVAALQEPDHSDATAPRTTLLAEGDGWRLRGEKVFVSAGASATHFVVSASGPDGLHWVLVPADGSGITVDRYPTHDGRGGANLRLDMALSQDHVLASGEEALAALACYREMAMLSASAESLGAMHAALDTTVEYTKQRVQFGQPLASFQALQHRMANMLIQIELARSLVYAACDAYDQGSADRGIFARAAKAKSALIAKRVTQEAIQLHGGIATTDEYIVGHFFKRVTALQSWVCSRGEALQEFMQLNAIHS